MTALAGLPAYLDLSQAIRLWKSIEKNLQGQKDSQRWTNPQMLMSLVLLTWQVEICMDDLEVLNKDEGAFDCSAE